MLKKSPEKLPPSPEGKSPEEKESVTIGGSSANGLRGERESSPPPDFEKLRPDPGKETRDKGKGKGKGRGRKSQAEKDEKARAVAYDEMIKGGVTYLNNVILSGMCIYFKRPINLDPEQRKVLDTSLYELALKYDVYTQYWAEIGFFGGWAAIFISNKLIKSEPVTDEKG